MTSQEIGICGCGNPEQVMEFMYKLLLNQDAMQKGDVDYKSYTENRDKIFKETPNDILFEIIFHSFEKSGLVEHGSSVYSSKLTQKGELFTMLFDPKCLLSLSY